MFLEGRKQVPKAFHLATPPNFWPTLDFYFLLLILPLKLLVPQPFIHSLPKDINLELPRKIF